jgi:drug/metabolite transporter (DMT)-like permease
MLACPAAAGNEGAGMKPVLGKVSAARLWPLTMLLFTAAGVGLQYSLNRVAIAGGVPFIPYVFWIAVFAGAGLLAVTVARGALPRLTRAHFRAFAILGFAGMAFPLSVLALVAPKLPASVVTLIQTLIPAFVYVMAWVSGVERFRPLGVAGVSMGLGGVLLLVVPEASLPETGMAGWIAVALVAPASLALAITSAARFRPPDTRSIAMATGYAVSAAVFLLPAMVVDGTWWFFDSGFDTAAWALIAVAVFYFFHHICFFEIVRLAGPVFFSTVNYLATAAGVMWAMAIFGEALSAWAWAALALMVCGLYLLGRGEATRGT